MKYQWAKKIIIRRQCEGGWGKTSPSRAQNSQNQSEKWNANSVDVKLIAMPVDAGGITGSDPLSVVNQHIT